MDFDHPKYDLLLDVVERLAIGANANQDPWHVYCFKEPTIRNAAATRGNHLFVWTGMLDFVQTEEELATVLAHELAHSLARHTDPDPSENVNKALIGFGAAIAGAAVGVATQGILGADILMNITSTLVNELGSGVFVYPYSQELELEADHIGLFIYAQAKYDPDKALDFWQRVQDDPNFSSDLQFFSTHPKAKDRISSLQKYLPAARTRYYAALGIADTSMKDPSTNYDLPVSLTQTPVSSWKVKGLGAVVYQSANIYSSQLGKIKAEAYIETVEDHGNWLRIEYPDKGYVRRADLHEARRR